VTTSRRKAISTGRRTTATSVSHGQIVRVALCAGNVWAKTCSGAPATLDATRQSGDRFQQEQIRFKVTVLRRIAQDPAAGLGDGGLTRASLRAGHPQQVGSLVPGRKLPFVASRRYLLQEQGHYFSPQG
jgi:hypothetical protein